MSRRQAIRWLAVRGAGVVAAALLVLWDRGKLGGRPAGRPASDAASGGTQGMGTSRSTAEGTDGLAPDAARAGLLTQVFRSRPDLHPPSVMIHVPAGPTALPGHIVTDCHYGPGQQGPLILDRKGELVWFLPLSPGGTPKLRAFSVQAQTYRSKSVLTWFQGAVVSGHGQGHYELYDSTYRQIAQVHAHGGYQGDLHEFALTDRGTALFTCYGESTTDLSSVGGPVNGRYFYGVVQEVDVASGKLLFQWRSDRHIGFVESYLRVPKSAPWDYFHINSICVDPSDGNLIISGRNTWAFYKVDRTTGKVLWRLGGKTSDFSMGPNAGFAFQHHVRRSADGTVTLFDNEGGPPREAKQSRGLVLNVDEGSRAASVAAQYDHAPPVVADDQGSVQDLLDQHRFIGWGDANYFTEYDGSGRAIFDGSFAAGTQSYRAFKQTWQGQPAEPPAMAVETSGGGVTVYASWNGATDVARWSVLGGANARRLRRVRVVSRSGFETAIAVPSAPGYLAVEALDAAGHTLSRSSVHRLRGD